MGRIYRRTKTDHFEGPFPATTRAQATTLPVEMKFAHSECRIMPQNPHDPAIPWIRRQTTSIPALGGTWFGM
jgi:hypothetical protein